MSEDNSEKNLVKKGILIGIVFVLMLSGIVYFSKRYQNSVYVDERSVMSAGFGKKPVLIVDGQEYTKKMNQTSVLVIGNDNFSQTVEFGFRNGGQADFLLLLVFDHEEKMVRALQIDRDTIADVTVLGVLGNETGTQRLQISLAYGFGVDKESNCKYTVKSVESLLNGNSIDHYVSLQMDSVGILNRSLGGVTVTLDEDFSKLDEKMIKGSTITLDDEQAKLFVRSRMSVGDGTNASRMKRQKTYMQAALKKLVEKMTEDANFVGQIYDDLESAMTTNMSRAQMINEANRAYSYDILPIESLVGEYKIGEDGFMEFHADEKELFNWVLKAFYEASPQN